MRPRKVLIVSHDRTISSRLRAHLPRSRYTVVPAVNELSSVAETVAKKKPDIIIVHIRGSRIPSGLETVRRIHRQSHVPVFVLSSPEEEHQILSAADPAVAGFIRDAFPEQDLPSLIENGLIHFQSEQSRTEQYRRQESILHSLGDAVLATNEKGIVTFMNAAAERLTGWSKTEAIGKKCGTVYRMVNGLTGKKLPDPALDVMKGIQRPPVGQILLRAKNETAVVIEQTAAPIEDEGLVTGVVMTFGEATSKHQSIDVLEKNVQRFRALIENSAEAVSILDRNGVVRFTTNAMTLILGYRFDEFIGRNAFEFVHPDEMTSNQQLFRSIVNNPGKTFRSQLRFLHRNGMWCQLDAVTTNLLNDPAVEGIVINFRDVTVQKEAEEKLHHSNKRLDLISRVTGEVIGTKPIQQQIREMAAFVVKAFDVDAAIVRILDNNELVLLACVGIQESVLKESIPANRGIGQKILQQRRSLSIRNLKKEFALINRNNDSSDSIPVEFLSYAGAPMLIGHTAMGIIGIYTKHKEREFTRTDLEHLQIVANHISVAVANNRLFREIREHNLEMKQHIEEQTRVERLLRVSEERYRAFVEQSSEGIYRTAFDKPIPITLPVDEQIRLMFERGYIAEANAEMAKMYGFSSIEKTIGKKITDLLIPSDPHNIDYMRTFIMNGYKFFDQESHEVDAAGADKYFLNNALGILEEDQWWGVWGTQRDITEKKMAEQALRESEERYRTLVEYSPNAIAVHVKGIVQFANQAAVKLVGAASVHQIVGTNVIDFVHPDFRHLAAKRIAKVYNNQAAPAQEQKWIRLDGTPVDVEVVSLPFMFEGEPAAQIIARDISERKAAEDALRESELRFRSLFENAKDAVFIADSKTGVIIDANTEAERLIKRARKDIIGMHQTQLHPADRVDEALSIFREQMLTLGEHPVEFEVVDATGHRIPIEIKASVIRLDDRRIVVQGIFRDITERKYAEASLRKSEEKYRSLFVGSKDGIYISTVDGSFIDVNPAMVELLGYASKEEVLALHIPNDVYFHPEERDKFQRAIESHSFIKDLDLSLKRKDGSEVSVLLTATVERNPDGTPHSYSGTVRDITERKRLEEQLIQAQKMESIGTLAGGIAHDFNNLLAMILGTAELVKHKTTENPVITNYINRIIEASERGASISKQLLLFARPEQAELRPVSLTQIVDQLAEFLTHFLPKNIVIKRSGTESSAVIMGDGGHLHQALVNLAINARDAMPEGGTISLHVDVVKGSNVRSRIPAAENHDHVAVTVSDTGSGMDPQIISRIFEPFFSTKERGKGTGLGLSIVHGIVQLHHGHLHVSSDRGRGTDFTLYFPSLPMEATDTPAQKEKMEQKHRATILVVDDEDMLREILAESLTEEGYTVLSASNGEEAFRLYREHKNSIALVITDLGMPMMNGEQLFEKIKELTPDVNVIVSSGFLNASNKSDLLRKGIRDVLAKPFKFEVIHETVRKVLEGS